MNLSNLLKKYQALSSPVKASVWFVICNVLQRGVSMITVPIFTRILTTEQYGVASVYHSWQQMITVFATLNLYYGVFNNGMTKYPKDRDGYLSSLQSLASVITLVILAVYLVTYKFWNEIFNLPTNLMLVMFVDIFFTSAFAFWSARQKYDYKYKSLVGITLFIAVGSPILAVICILLVERSAEARILSFALVNIIVGACLYYSNLKKGKKFFDAEYWKYALCFNIPILPHYLSQTFLQQSGRIMIADMEGEGKAAIYSVAYSVAMLMLLVTNGINNTYIPYTYKCLKNNKYDSLKKNTNYLVVFVGICVLFMMLFGPEVIKIFATSEYYEAIWIIPPVSLAVYFMFLYPLFGNIEFYYEEKKYVTIASVIGAVANILLNIVLIDKFGYIAAGYSTLLCYILFSVCHYVFMKKVINKNIPNTEVYNMKFIGAFSCVVIVAMVYVLMIYKWFIARWMTAIVLLLALLIRRNDVIRVLKELGKK